MSVPSSHAIIHVSELFVTNMLRLHRFVLLHLTQAATLHFKQSYSRHQHTHVPRLTQLLLGHELPQHNRLHCAISTTRSTYQHLP